ncbi:MAG: alanine--tRNA ligase-related protein, partial [Gordonibacter sp.]
SKDADKAWSTYGGIMNDILEETGATEFVGYTKNEAEVRVVGLARCGKRVEALVAGESGELVVDVTPFYAEKGGQVGDIGVFTNAEATARVTNTQEP